MGVLWRKKKLPPQVDASIERANRWLRLSAVRARVQHEIKKMDALCHTLVTFVIRKVKRFQLEYLLKR